MSSITQKWLGGIQEEVKLVQLRMNMYYRLIYSLREA